MPPQGSARTRPLLAVLLTAGLLAPVIVAHSPGPSAEPDPVTDESLAGMDAVIAEMDDRWRPLDGACDPDAVFALVYLVTTRMVREFVKEPYFDEGNLMTDYDALFADFYFDAYDAYHAQGSDAVAGPWREAFERADSGRSTVFEDAMLGLNAHINYDLAIVTFEMGYPARGLKADYDRINDVLDAAIREVTKALADHYDPLFEPNAAHDLTDPAVTETIHTWREHAWQNAVALTDAEDEEERDLIKAVMEQEAVLAAQAFQLNPTDTRDGRVAYCQDNP